jgi:RimJ/RimL family protein N-acetyltransferase
MAFQRGKFFIFAIQSSNGEIAGAIDIKNEELDGGEIGYWIHKDHSGLALNAVAAIKDIENKPVIKDCLPKRRPTT